MSIIFLPLIAVLTASVAPTSEAYSLDIVDCTNPSTIKKFNKETICRAEEPTQEVPVKERYTILQRPTLTKVHGYSCEVRVSLYHFKCGVWGHLKLQQVPQTMRHEEITAENCRRMSLLQEYQISGYGDPIKVKLNRPTYVSATLAGSLKMEDDKITCIGQTIRMGDTIHYNTLKLAEYQILLKEETFLVSNNKVESETDHLSLPCPYHKGECITGAATFVWNINDSSCTLQMVNTINPLTTMDTYLVDHQQQVLLNTTGAMKLMHCPFNVITTDHDGIYLGKTSELSRLATIDPGQIDVNLQAAVHLNYLAYSMRQTFSQLDVTLRKTICETHYHGKSDQPVLLHEQTYGLLKGDLLMTFQCTKRTQKIKDDINCYQDIPLDPDGYADAATKHYKLHSTRVTCSATFPLTVKSKEGWIQLTPAIIKTQAPMEMTIDTPLVNWTDFSHGGIYTERERAEWLHTLTFPSYTEASLKEITYGLCIGDGNCNQLSTNNLPLYTLDNLVPDMEREIDLWSSVKSWLHEYGDLMAFACLVILGLKFITDLICIILTFLRVGPGAAIALVAHLYLYNKHSYQKLMRKKKADTRTERREPTTTAETTSLLPTTSTPKIQMTEIQPIMLDPASLPSYNTATKTSRLSTLIP